MHPAELTVRIGGSGNDFLAGSADGDDRLDGGPGGDRYVYRRGGGHELIVEADDGSGEHCLDAWGTPDARIKRVNFADASVALAELLASVQTQTGAGAAGACMAMSRCRRLACESTPLRRAVRAAPDRADAHRAARAHRA